MNAGNAKEMMDYTGIYQVHSSCKDWLHDSTTSLGDVATPMQKVNTLMIMMSLVKNW